MRRHRTTTVVGAAIPPDNKLRVTCDIAVSMEALAALPEPQLRAFMKGVGEVLAAVPPSSLPVPRNPE